MVPALAIYDPAHEPPDSSPTIREAWEALIRRDLRSRGGAESTLQNHRTYLRRFEHWWANSRLQQPRVAAVGRAELRDWRDWLQAEFAGVDPQRDDLTPDEIRKLSAVAALVNKHVSLVQQILRACCDEGLVPAAIRLKRLDAIVEADKVELQPDEVGALYRACDGVQWPTTGREDQLRWKSLIVTLTTYGPRIQDAYAYDSRRGPLRWENVLTAPACPGNDGRDSWPDGWISYVPWKTRRKKPLPVIVPISAEARRHFDALRELGGESGLVWPWPRSGKAFRAEWAAICRRASAGRERSLETITPQNLRQTAHSWHEDVGGQKIADLVTGHAARGVSARFYDVPYRRLCEHFGRMTWPEAFADPLPRPDRQLRLF